MLTEPKLASIKHRYKLSRSQVTEWPEVDKSQETQVYMNKKWRTTFPSF